jgi:RNase P/RNase MRP subunit p29
MRWSSLALLLTLGLLAAARADVVHLTNGNTLSGTVVSEDEREVVVKTADGKVVLPRALVKEVVKQSKGETQIAMALERAKAGDDEAAERLFEQAAQDPDPAVAARAKRELAAWRERRDRAKRFVPKPRTPLELPDDAQGQKPAEGNSLQDALDRARRAIEMKDGGRARRVLAPLVEANPKDPKLRFLLGRALELDQDDLGAREAYLKVLGEGLLREARPTAWLGELCRRQLAGEPLDAASPGVEGRWQRVETRRFAVYHRFARVEPWFATEPELAFQEVLDRLGYHEHELHLQGRIQVFIFEDVTAYKANKGLERAGGHAERHLAPDGWLKVIKAYPDRNFYRTTYRHEVAHTVLFDVLPSLPAWAHEGAACACESNRTRGQRRQVYQGRKQKGTLHDTLQFLKDEAPRGETVEDVRTYYAQASVLFDALASLRESPRDALAAAMRLQKDGPERGLLMLDITRAQLEAACDRVAADQRIGPED